MALPDRYRIVLGSSRDRVQLLKFLQATYSEIFPQQADFSHLAQTVDRYLASTTPLWWVEARPKAPNLRSVKIATLWLGNAIDQVTGQAYAHVLNLYVHPDHRRQGIATALLDRAQTWAEERGDRQIGLQVFSQNQPAQNLYQNLGFIPQSLFLFKPIPTAAPANVHPDN